MMTREEVIRLAQQYCDYSSDSKGRESFEFDDYGLYHFAQLVAAEYKRDALHYRWLREQNATLEDRTFYVGIDGRCIYPGHDWPWRVFHCLLLWLQVVDFAEV